MAARRPFWKWLRWKSKASAYGHHQYAYEIWNWNSNANLTFAPETMSSTDRRTDKVNPVYPPPTSLGGGIIKICAEYRDMLPRPRLDLSSTPGSWQTSLGLGSMSRYSAQILQALTTPRKIGQPAGKNQVAPIKNQAAHFMPSPIVND